MAGYAPQLPNIHGEDVCVVCYDRLAEVLTECGHRVICEECMQNMARRATRRGLRPMCPTCREPINAPRDGRYLQLSPVTPAEAEPDGQGHYPFAVLDFSPADGDDTIAFADSDIMRRVRAAVHAANNGALDMDVTFHALQDQLTPQEQELAMIELLKDTDLHGTVTVLTSRLARRVFVWEDVARHMVRRTIEGQDAEAMAARAVFASASDVALGVVTGGIRSLQGFSAGNGATNAFALVVFSSIDIYRWSKGELTAKQLGLNIGEHVVGCGCGFAGSVGGAALGAACGPAAPVTVVLFSLIGGALADFVARTVYGRAVITCSGKRLQTEDEARQQAITDAAAHLGIDLRRDGFVRAKEKFRSKILASHPDHARAQGQEPDDEAAAKIIACWQIVRGRYESRGQLRDGDGSKAPEALVRLWVMKVRENASGSWQVVRSWFGDMDNAPASEGELEKVECLSVYM